jgi:hypothetical protein
LSAADAAADSASSRLYSPGCALSVRAGACRRRVRSRPRSPLEMSGAKSYEPFLHLERAELARLNGDDSARQRELRKAHRLFTKMYEWMGRSSPEHMETHWRRTRGHWPSRKALSGKPFILPGLAMTHLALGDGAEDGSRGGECHPAIAGQAPRISRPTLRRPRSPFDTRPRGQRGDRVGSTNRGRSGGGNGREEPRARRAHRTGAAGPPPG